jgi:hypothetical protein
LKPLPRNRFVVATWSTGTVAPDIHVKVGRALYSVPWRLIGQQVQARSTATTVQLVHDGQVVATHLWAERGRRTNYDHYPPEKIAFHLRTPSWCRTTAETVGPACVQVIADLMVDGALFRLRAAQGILGLRTRYGADALEAACQAALTAGDPSYRTVKGILAIQAATGTDTDRPQAAAGGHAARAAATPAFLRGPDSLFSDDLFSDGLFSDGLISEELPAGPGPHTQPQTGPASGSAAVLHLPTTSQQTTSQQTTSQQTTSQQTTSSAVASTTTDATTSRTQVAR